MQWERRATALNAEVMKAVDKPDDIRERVKRRRAYAVARVARLTADIGPRLMTCATEGLPIACKCGLVGAKKTCRQWWLCSDCRAKRSPSLGADIRRGLQHALDEALTAWGRDGGKGQRPRIYLLTLTQRHSGDLGADQQAIADGWRRTYKRLHEDDGAFPYVGVWEVTRGRDGLGHVHLHIAVVWSFRDWGRIREQWLAACPTSEYLDIQQRKAKDADGKPKESTPASVSNYLGKYLSKGVDENFDGRLRAEVSAAFYNQRSVLTSRYFWRRREKCCKKCNERFRLVEIVPASFSETIHDGVLNLYFHGLEPPSNADSNPS